MKKWIAFAMLAMAMVFATTTHAEADKKAEAKTEAKADAKPKKASKLEKQIGAILEDWKKALVAKDLDKVMTFYSENFKHYEYGDKKGMRQFLDQAKDSGYLDGLEVDITKTAVKEDKEIVSAYPIEIKGTFGAITMELKFAKEGKTYLVVGSDASGM